MAIATTEIIKIEKKQSVQKLPDASDGNLNNRNLLIGRSMRGPLLPAYGTREREYSLLQFYRNDYNNLFKAAISVLVKQVQSTPWEVKGNPESTEYFQGILLNADFGRGWESFISKLLIDYSRYDAGAYIELIGPGDPTAPMTGPITGISALDSLRCWPTGDPLFPVIYYDALGKTHVLPQSRVVRFYDMPDTNEMTFGYSYGECSLSRTIGAVSREILINRYIEQVLDGNPAPGLLIFKNITDMQLRDAIAKMEQERSTDFGGQWGRTIRLFGLQSEVMPEVLSVPYSTAPESFNFETFKNIDAREIAAGVGVDVQDFWELTGGSNLGTATQSLVLHEKAKGKALGRVLKTLERVINQAMPESMQFEFKYRDDQEDQAEADKASTWANIALSLEGKLSPEQITQLLVNQVPAIRDVTTDESGEIIRLPDDDPKSDAQMIPVKLESGETVEVAIPLTTGENNSDVEARNKIIIDQMNRAMIDVYTAATMLGQRPADELRGMYWVGNQLVPQSELQNIWKYGTLIAPSTTNADLLVQAEPEVLPTEGDTAIGEGIAAQPQTPTNGKPMTTPDEAVVSDTEAQSSNPDAQVLADTEKAIEETKAGFRDIFKRLVEMGNDDKVSRSHAGIVLRAQLQESGEKIYLDGLADGGVKNPELDDADKQAISEWRASQSGFATSFLDDVFSDKDFQDSEIIRRSDAWINKSLNPLYYLALGKAAQLLSKLVTGIAKKTALFMWVVDPRKEHCRTCLKMNGQVHTMKSYIKSGILPQSSALECGGWECGCQLIPSDKKPRGRLASDRTGIGQELNKIFQRIISFVRR